MSRQQRRAALIDFLKTVAKPGQRLDEIDDDINLIRAEVIDSFALIQIIFHLEQTYDVNLQVLGVDPADLGSIGGILSVIDRSGR